MCLGFLLDSRLFGGACVCVEGGGVVSLYDLVFCLLGRDGVAICWRRIALRKYLKQETGKFLKTMSIPFLPSGLSIQASQVLAYPSVLMVVVAPSPFRLFSHQLEPGIIKIPDLMHTSQTQNWNMCNFQAAWLENNFSHAVTLHLC